MSKSIDNSEDIIDSRDIINRISDLRGTLEELISTWKNSDSEHYQETLDDLCEWLGCESDGFPEDFTGTVEDLEEWGTFSDEANELRTLEELAADAQSSPDWIYGASLIRDSYFEDYARQYASDFGNAGETEWPYTHIDWEKAANSLKQDYTRVTFNGEEYWVRD